MMRKPYPLASVLLLIVLCSWMMDATIFDVESNIDAHDLRTGAGPQDAFAFTVSGYSIYRKALWSHPYVNREQPPPLKLLESAHVPKSSEKKTLRKSNITTLFLLGCGILGIVGFWRRLKR